MKPAVVDRIFSSDICSHLAAAGLDPVLARVLAARGITDLQQLDGAFKHLLPPNEMHNIERLAVILADAIASGQRLLIVADYDSDGATACAVGMLALRQMRAQV